MLSILCICFALVSPSLLGSHYSTLAVAPGFMLLTALSSSSLWVLSFNRSMSFDLTTLSTVKTALSKQACHWDQERGVLHSSKPPCYVWGFASYLGHSLRSPVCLFLSFAGVTNSGRVTSHRCTEEQVALMSHMANISFFSLNAIPAVLDYLLRAKPDRGEWNQSHVETTEFALEVRKVTCETGVMEFLGAWTNKPYKSLPKVHAKSIQFSCS